MKEALVAQIATQATQLILPLLALIGMWVGNQLRLKLKSETAIHILDRFERLAGAVVKEIDQTVVHGLKAAAADGQLTEEEVAEVFTKAVFRLQELVGDKGMKEFQGFVGDAQKALTVLIESKVKELRLVQASVPTVPKLFSIPPASPAAGGGVL